MRISRHTKFLKAALTILFLNSVIESVLLLVTDRTAIIIIQLTLNFYFFFRFFFFFPNIKWPKLTGLIIFIVFYFVLLGIQSSELILTYNYLVKFVVPFLYFIIGYNIFVLEAHFQYFLKRIWIFLCYFSIYIIVANLLGVGVELYSNGIKMGFYSLNGLYIPTFCIITILYNYKLLNSRASRMLAIVFSVLTSVLLILLLKRTLILILIMALLVYILKNFRFKKSFRFGISFLVLCGTLTYFSNDVVSLIETRSSRFNRQYKIVDEGRFTENIYIYDMMKNSVLKLVFGSGEVFNDRKSLTALGVFGEREAHNSYIRLFWSGGIIGLLAFIFFYFRQFSSLLRFYKSRYVDSNIKQILFFALVFVGLRFLNDFSSGITYLAYNAYSYLLIGGILRMAAIKIISISPDPVLAPIT